MDLVLRNLRLSEGETTVLTDLGIAGGRIAAGHPADLVVLDCESAEAAVQTLASPLMGFKNGRRTFTRRPAQLHRP